MSTASRYQGGMKKESAYATAATVDWGFDVISDTIAPQYAPIESKALRRGFAPHQDQFVKYPLGPQGSLKMEVAALRFTRWLYQMMGAVDTTTSLVNASYKVHTYTMAEFNGTSFTWQGNRPTFPADGDLPFTFSGGKVTKWTLANAATGLLELDVDCDFRDFTTGTTLATLSYSSPNPLFSFLGGQVLIDGTSVNAYDIKVMLDNQLKVDRRYLDNSGGLKREPVGNGNFRVGTWEATMDFEDMTQMNRVMSASAADGAVVQLKGTWGIPGADISELDVTIPAARFDDGWPQVSGPASLQQQLKGIVMYDGTNSPATLTYTTQTSNSS